MIETYKIVSGKYENEIAPTLAMLDTHNYRKLSGTSVLSLVLNMICVSFIF